MAFSYATYPGNGSNQLFTIPCDYLSKTHIGVTVDGVSVPFTITGPYQVTVTTAPANGTVVRVFRVTPKDTALVTFVDGSTLNSADLNIEALQALFIVQESDDAIFSLLQEDANGNLDATTRRIINLGDPTDAQDAATKTYVDNAPNGMLGDTVSARDAAIAAAASASISAGNASTSETNSAASAVAANNSVIAAAAIVAGTIWSDVVFLTNANSPYTVTSGHKGKLLSVDTSGGAVTINLPAIAGLSMPFTLGVKKATGDANAVVINRASTDLIDAATSKSLIGANQGTTLIADTDPSPDKWTTADFGSSYADPLTTKGDILTRNGSATVRKAVSGSNGKVATEDSTAAEGWDWKDVPIPVGGIVQKVINTLNTPASSTALIPFDNTIPQIGEGTELITAVITPKYSTSLLLIEVDISMSSSSGNGYSHALFRDAIANAIAAGFSPAGNVIHGSTRISAIVSAGSTAATTFRYRYGPGLGAGTAYANQSAGAINFGNVPITMMTITEIKQ